MSFQLKDDFDRGGQITLTMETGVHDVATLLKEFFRDLPEPIIPKDLHPALLSIQSKNFYALPLTEWKNSIKEKP